MKPPSIAAFFYREERKDLRKLTLRKEECADLKTYCQLLHLRHFLTQRTQEFAHSNAKKRIMIWISTPCDKSFKCRFFLTQRTQGFTQSTAKKAGL
jgi:hypothetical protein